MNPTPLYIFDLDGTLADLKHRRHHVEMQDGSRVTINGTPAIYRGLNPKVEGDCWVEFDGTGKWRYHPSDVKFKPNWDAFHAACVDDTPIWPVIETLKRLFVGGADIWVWSGRMDTVHAQTMAWLNNDPKVAHCIDQLKMRPAGDYTPDDKLKEQWLNELPTAERMRLMAVFDDRDRVVAMWRRNGVQCFQAAPGDF